jgi:hypothetical protein
MAQEQTPPIGSKEELQAYGDFRYTVAITNACMIMIERTESTILSQRYIQRAKSTIGKFRQKLGSQYRAYSIQIDEISNIIDNAEITLQEEKR